MGKLRLLHIEMKAVFVDDDGENLNVLEGSPFVVTGAEVSDFSERWADQFLAMQAKHEGDSGA